MGEVQDYSINKELRTEKFGISLTPVAQQSTISDPSALGTMTTVGTNTGTAGAGLTLIGDTSTVDQSGALMNDLKALQEDIAAIKTAVDSNNAAIDTIIDRLQAFGMIA